MGAITGGTCRVCREVKDGRLPELPVGLTPVGETIPGGVVIRTGEGPLPFVCGECEARQRRGEVCLVAGQVLEAKIDDGWVPGLFVRGGDPAEAEVVRDPAVETGEYRRDVAFVRVLGRADDQAVPYARIRLPA